MGYKRSKYNVEIDTLEDGQKLIYNTFTGIFGIMDLKTQSLYHMIENVDIDSISDEELKENAMIMLRSGYIVDAQKDELATVRIERAKAKFGGDALLLTIAPTLGCNMRCPYCFENKNGKRMSAEIQSQVLEFVKAKLNADKNVRAVSVSWYGGEPLLEKKTIYALSKELIQICNDRGLNYSATVITNGALLDLETANMLFHECKVKRAQITIDGMPEKHNKRRIFADGTGSFDLIIKNIEACRSFFPISVRVNVDQSNIDDVEPLAKFLLEEKGWTDNPRVYIAPVTNYDEGCKDAPCLQMESFADVKREFEKVLYSYNRNLVSPSFFPGRKSVFCGGECVNNYVIDPEGYFYNCWVVIGEKERASGHISKPFLINTEYSSWILSDLPKECEACEYLPMCMGGCPYFRVEHDGKPSCVHTRYSYKETLKLAYQDYVTQKNKA